MNNSGRTRRWLAALFTLLVLVTGVGASQATNYRGTDNQVVDPYRCEGRSVYDQPVGMRGTFIISATGKKTEKRRFNDCYLLNADGELLTVDGPMRVVGGSIPFARGYKHGADARRGADDQYRMHFVGDGKHDNYFDVNQFGEIRYKGTWKKIGVWSDWYNAGYRAGSMAEARKQHAIQQCQNSVQLVDVTPTDLGPELTFKIKRPLPEIRAQRVVAGFRAVTDTVREPRVEGTFPWCVNITRIDEDGPGWSLMIDIGHRWVRLGYIESGSIAIVSLWLPGRHYAYPQPISNEGLWDKKFRKNVDEALTR